MVRNVIGSILALAGATAAVWSPFRAWYDGRHGSDYRIEDLFGGITDARADFYVSLLLPFAFAALLTLIGLVLRSRPLVAIAGVVTLGFAVLWMVRVAQVEDGLSVDTDGTGLGIGVALALAGGVLLLLASAVMSGRRTRRIRVDDHRDGQDRHPYDDGRDRHPYDADEPRWDQGQQPHGPYPDQHGHPDQGGYGYPDQGGQGPHPGQGSPYPDQHGYPDQGGQGPYPDEPPPPRR
ncbi:hypothetical protein ACWGIN_21450 [Streptomyces sp. NPDC054861]